MPHCTVTSADPLEALLGPVLDRTARRHGDLGGEGALRFIPEIAIDRTPEVVDAATDRAPHLGQSLGPEHDQRDDENKEQMRRLENVTDHG
jgi:hypothetical protein